MLERKDIVIFGTGGHARVLHDIALDCAVFNVIGFVAPRAGGEFCGLPVFGDDSLASSACRYGVIGIGDNHLRMQVAGAVQGRDAAFQFVTLVHPSAQRLRGVEIGAGSVVMPGALINSAVSIGMHCILNTGCAVDHDGVIEDFASIAPGAVLGGSVKVGRGTAVALGAKVIHGISIGPGSVVGAGALVLHDVAAGVLAYGSPCRTVRSRQPDEPYY
jgi:sugar O-acyltransferase (sialic acid O-acetyltransferase NeuD family)